MLMPRLSHCIRLDGELFAQASEAAVSLISTVTHCSRPVKRPSLIRSSRCSHSCWATAGELLWPSRRRISIAPLAFHTTPKDASAADQHQAEVGHGEPKPDPRNGEAEDHSTECSRCDEEHEHAAADAVGSFRNHYAEQCHGEVQEFSPPALRGNQFWLFVLQQALQCFEALGMQLNA